MKIPSLFFLLFLCAPVFSQTSIPDDTSTIDNIVNAVYKIVSGPAGKRDWKRFKNLFDPEGSMGIISEGDGSKHSVYKKFTPDEYIANNDEYFLTHDFVETETARGENKLSDFAQVFSNYQSISGNEKKKGVNTFLLFYYNKRWWIASLIWQEQP